MVTILRVVLSGCKLSCVVLEDEHRLKLFENIVIERICAHTRERVTGGWRKFLNEELHDLYSS
jgi:hypothetical protein